MNQYLQCNSCGVRLPVVKELERFPHTIYLCLNCGFRVEESQLYLEHQDSFTHGMSIHIKVKHVLADGTVITEEVR